MKKEKQSALVIFGKDLPKKKLAWWKQFDVVLTGDKLEEFIDPGSIYEASTFAEELSCLKMPDGTSISKSFIYEGYELWWIHYDSLFLYLCLPYTQYKRLLQYLKDFKNVYFYKPTFKTLFSSYLEAYGCKMTILREPGLKNLFFLPFGIMVQILLTFISLPILMIKRPKLMVFTGDKFEKSTDYDSRMIFIYQELCQKNLQFVEFIRSLESWKTVLKHAFVRKRPVIYSLAVAFIGKFVNFKSFDIKVSMNEPNDKFKLLLAISSLKSVYDDVCAIRIMRWILHIIGIKTAFIPAATERNFHTVLGCKLNSIPTVGILHGVASRYYNLYDFLPGFNGEKMLSVDKYGLWSEWWKEYYLKNSKAYNQGQLFVSGPMRPLLPKSANLDQSIKQDNLIKVLFVSEQVAVPNEVFPYLKTLLKTENISLHLTFRPYRDGFEIWLKDNHPEIFDKFGEDKILRKGIYDAISKCDVIVGSYSTGVLEALLQLKIPLFFRTQKWGDYYNLKNYDKKQSFFAENPDELAEKIKNSRSVSPDAIKDLRERYFGDPYKNGSKWVVDQLEKVLLKGYLTK